MLADRELGSICDAYQKKKKIKCSQIFCLCFHDGCQVVLGALQLLFFKWIDFCFQKIK